MGKNLAEKYSKNVDERFKADSFAKEVVNESASEWAGVETVHVTSMPVTPTGTYDENNVSNVYGTPYILERAKQTMTVTQKPTINFRIRRLDKLMNQMMDDAGEALSREIDEVIIPQYDHYVFSKISSEATNFGNALIGTKPTKANAYEMFLKGMEHLGNAKAPLKGRIAVCSYAYYNLLKQDPAFVRYGDASQAMLSKGILGDVDGCKIMRVPSDVLPAGASCIITHPYAVTAPTKLTDYIIHDNPPGWNGWAVEGLLCYDAFVLNNKANGIFYIGSSGVNKFINVSTMVSNTASDKTIVTVMTPKDTGHTWKYTVNAARISTENGQEPNAADGAAWAALENGQAVTATNGQIITVVELDADGKVVGEGSAKVNVA